MEFKATEDNRSYLAISPRGTPDTLGTLSEMPACKKQAVALGVMREDRKIKA